ncbi:DUF4334 domain-containing protein [Abyssibacter profundi]|nr:DUF4334 domain-containing protein [Abyssibacter profundi]
MRTTILCTLLSASLALVGCNSNHSPETTSTSEAPMTFKTLIKSGEAVAEDRLMSLYDELEPVDLDFMLGQWSGGKFDGGAEPDPINWYGKRFDSRDHVEPLLAHAPDGSIYAFDKLGAARMRMIEFRGAVTASLIYDKQPIMDYFRKVDDDTVIGAGEVKGKPGYMFFYLQRETPGGER